MRRSQTLEEERRQLEEDVAEANALTDGIEKLLGEGYSNALRYRYLENRRWPEVSELLEVCQKTAYNRAAAAFDTIAALGPRRVMQAQGMAIEA